MANVIPRVGQWIEAVDGIDPGYVAGVDPRRREAAIQWLSRDDDAQEDALSDEPDFPFSQIGGVIVDPRLIGRLNKQRALIASRGERRRKRCREARGRS